jgi:hypothetical protein
LIADAEHAAVHPDDVAALLRASRGRPGWLVMAGNLLRSRRYWSGDGRIHLTLLGAEISIATTTRLFTT